MNEPETPAAPAETKSFRTMPISLLGDEVLRKPARPIKEFNADVRELAEIMVHTMHRAHGIGLAAPQIGVPFRVIVVEDRTNNRVLRLANPVLREKAGEDAMEEGCLSCPQLQVMVTRAATCTVEAFDIVTEQPIVIEATDLEAKILQHEMDHLNGKLIVDYLSRLKREMYKKRLGKKIKLHDRHQARTMQIVPARDERDHPQFTEPKR